MFLLDAPFTDQTQHSPGWFLLWDIRQHRFKNLNQQTLPGTLVPYPEQSWPEQLDAPHVQSLLAFLQQQSGQLCIHLQGQSWSIHSTTPDAAHRMLFVQPVLEQQNQQHLALFEFSKQMAELKGPARSLRILEELQYWSHCDRLSLWLTEPTMLSPVYWSDSSPLPLPIHLANSRYLRALEVRQQLGISDTFHQPILAQQHYHQEHGILARLDTAIIMDKKVVGILMLEYRQIQQSFATELFAIAKQAARLLAETGLSVLPSIPTDMPHDETVESVWLQWMEQLSHLHGRPFLETLGAKLAQQYSGLTDLILTRVESTPSHRLWIESRLSGPSTQPMIRLDKENLAQLSSLQQPGWLSIHLPLGNDSASDQRQMCGFTIRDQHGSFTGLLIGVSDAKSQHKNWHQLNSSPARLAWLQAVLCHELDYLQKEEQRHIQELATNHLSSIAVLNRYGQITAVNHVFQQQTGYTTHQILGQSYATLRPHFAGDTFFSNLSQTLRRHESWQGEEKLLNRDGFIIPVQLKVDAIWHGKQISHYVCAFQDISQQKWMENRIETLAYQDDLTGLPNRRSILKRLNELESTSAPSHWHMLFLLDIDNFKTINDSLGHICGDLLLIKIVQRLKQAWTDADLARISGDQFLLLLPTDHTDELSCREDAQNRIEVLIRLFQPVFDLNGIHLHITCASGVTLFQHVTEPLELLKQVEIAAHLAKKQGLPPYAFFSHNMADSLRNRLEMNTRLRNALVNREFLLYYQPQYDTATGRLIGAEALIRWQHQDQMIMPNLFIPIAEETSMINEIGWWVLKEACQQYISWADLRYTLPSLSVNVSARQFHCHDFTQQVHRILQETQMPPNYLTLEITESVVLENLEDTILKMKQLRQMGINFSIDDFGTGYSSLSYLKQLPVNEIKLDRSFINQLANDRKILALVSCIVTLAKNFGFRVVAEGVETEQQLHTLKTLRCDSFQGYIRHKPLKPHDFTQLLSGRFGPTGTVWPVNDIDRPHSAQNSNL